MLKHQRNKPKNKSRCPYGKERGVEELAVLSRELCSMEILLLAVGQFKLAAFTYIPLMNQLVE